MSGSNIIRKPLQLLSNMPRWQKQLFIMAFDLVVMIFALHFLTAARLRSLDYDLPLQTQAIVYGLSFVFLFLSGLYQEILRSFNENLFKK